MSVIKRVGPPKDPTIEAGFRYSFEFDSRVDLQGIEPIDGVDVREDVIHGMSQQFKMALRSLVYGKA